MVLALGGCASPPKPSVAGSVAAPLADLNLLRSEVPPVLLEALRNPYELPADQGCVDLQRQIRALDEVLGPDLEPPRTAEGKDGRGERPALDLSAADAENALLAAIRRTAEGLVPYRSWVRKISGAEQYEKYLATTVAAGNIRRAFLKGLRIAQRCP